VVDLAVLKRTAEAGDGADEVPITRRCLAQIVDELTACRTRPADAFGLRGKTL